MNCYRRITFYCIVISYIFCQFSVTGGHAATSTKTPPRPVTPKTNGTKTTGKYPSRTGGKIITLRFGADGSTSEEQCECRLFYLCAQENTVDTSQNGQSCDDNNVCCKIDGSTPTEPPVVTGSTDPSATEPYSAVPTGTPTTSPEDCQCVPVGQCQRSREDEMSGAGAIDERKTPCRSSEVCCSLPNIITPATPVLTSSSTQPPYSSPDCGIRNSGQELFNRIASPDHLKNTSFGEFPWMALLLTAEIDPNTQQRLDNVFVCGASLISSKIVLTAGHCVHDINDVTLLKVRVGEYDTRAEANKEQKPHQDRQVLKITRHPQFNSKTLYNDFALLEVVDPFDFDYHVNPICIPLVSSTYDYDPINCVATGWGKNAFGQDSQYPTTLKKVDLTIVPNDQCQTELRKTRLGQYFILDPSFMCAGGQAGMDTCEGDGGGPLACPLRNNPTRYVQVGIVSWGIGCANSYPAAYASLEKNLEWLTQEFNAAAVFGSSSIGERKKSP